MKNITDKKIQREIFFRRLKWIFSKSGVLSLAFEHFLAMVPATILVPLLVNNSIGASVIDVSLVLFCSGLGTIIFTIISKGNIPAYVSSSFAYIGLTIYLVQNQSGIDSNPHLAFVYVGWSYIFSGLLLILLSFIYCKKGIDKILSFLLPASIVGPAISLIGLELADTAIVDSGFDLAEGMVDSKAALVSMVTLGVIVFFTLLRRKILKNSAIIIGLIIGWVVDIAINGAPNISKSEFKAFSVPDFYLPVLKFPPNIFSLFLAVIPATFIVFTENIGRVTVIDRMAGKGSADGLFNEKSVVTFRKALLSQGVSSLCCSFIGSVPNTIYAENIAVIGIHKSNNKKKDPDPMITRLLNPTSSIPCVIAAILAMMFAFVGPLEMFLLKIPKPVIGGMELFLFGIISAPGIQLLVEQRVDYNKISNQIITAAVLISGVSGLSVNLGFVELKGMGLGFVVGVALNLLVQFLKWFGSISDTVTFEEVLISTLSAVNVDSNVVILNPELKEVDEDIIIPSNMCKILSKGDKYYKKGDNIILTEYIRNLITYSSKIELGLQENNPIITIKSTANEITIEIIKSVLDDISIQKNLNDYEDSFDCDENLLLISVSRSVPLRKVRSIIKNATQNLLNSK